MAFTPGSWLTASLSMFMLKLVLQCSYFSRGTKSSTDMTAKASTFSFTLCSQVLHIALCLVCVCTQSFMQYLCKAIPTLLSCCALYNVDIASKIKYSWIKSVLMIFFFYFATYHLVDFSPIPPTQVISSTLRSIRCCLQDSLLTFLCSSFTVHQFQEGKETQELPEQPTPYIMWTGERSFEWTRLTMWL